MKKILLICLLALLGSAAASQNRIVTRGAEPGELYLASFWYGVYSDWGPPYYDTLRTAVYRLTENGKKLTIQYSADYFADAETNIKPEYIIADVTPGVLYNKQVYEKNYYDYTQLWVSFDYGKSWTFREEDIGSKHYYGSNFDGLLYRGGGGVFNSEDYGNTFNQMIGAGYSEDSDPGLQEEELYSIVSKTTHYILGHTYDYCRTFTTKEINSQYVFGNMSGCFPDVFRGGMPGEVYITSWFPNEEAGYGYRASFSADTGQTFRHIYIEEPYFYHAGIFHLCDQLFFMSDREPGVFYILRLKDIIDLNPYGWHTQLCVDYYRDYGETLVDTYCHDLTKDYNMDCEAVNDLVSDKQEKRNVFLSWTDPESSSPIEGYSIYRNEELMNETLCIDTSYFDEALSEDVYSYYVVAHYEIGCESSPSNVVTETICLPIDDLTADNFEKDILLAWTKPTENLVVNEYHIFRDEIFLEATKETTYWDRDLPVGKYSYYIETLFNPECGAGYSNMVEAIIDVGIHDKNDEQNIVIYPNPTGGEFQIQRFKNLKSHPELDSGQRIHMFDIFGQQVFETTETTFDIGYLPAGVYILRIETKEQIITKRIVKH